MKLITNLKNSLLISLFFTLSFSVSANEKPDAKKLFKQKCSLCHALDQKKLGPAVKNMSKDADTLRTIISKGKKPMPSFEGKLSDAEINALVNYLMANQ